MRAAALAARQQSQSRPWRRPHAARPSRRATAAHCTAQLPVQDDEAAADAAADEEARAPAPGVARTPLSPRAPPPPATRPPPQPGPAPPHEPSALRAAAPALLTAAALASVVGAHAPRGFLAPPLPLTLAHPRPPHTTACALANRDALASALSAFVGSLDRDSPSAAASFWAAYAALELVGVPALPLTLSAGALFGTARGCALVSTAGLAAAALSFVAARHLARAQVARLLAGFPQWKAVDAALARQGASSWKARLADASPRLTPPPYPPSLTRRFHPMPPPPRIRLPLSRHKVVALLRMSPLLPFAATNYTLGLSRLSFGPYLVGTWLGMLPGTLLYVAGGDLGKSWLAGVTSSGAAAQGGAGGWWGGLDAGDVASHLLVPLAGGAAVVALSARLVGGALSREVGVGAGGDEGQAGGGETESGGGGGAPD